MVAQARCGGRQARRSAVALEHRGLITKITEDRWRARDRRDARWAWPPESWPGR